MYEEDSESFALLDRNINDEDVNEKARNKTSHATLLRRSQPFSCAQWLIIFVFAFILVDTAVYIYIAHTLLGTSPSGISKLELGNTYVGLDELYASGTMNTSHYDPIINRPRIAAQISKDKPNKVFPNGNRRVVTSYGMLSTPDTHLRVSNDVHTILQFRILDYGMERCQLALRLPARKEVPYIFRGDSSSEIHLNVCLLDASRELDVRKLSWDSRPPCVSQAGIVSAHADSEVLLPDFPCQWGKHYTFEVGCASDLPDCRLDMRASQSSPWGIFMYQHQTV